MNLNQTVVTLSVLLLIAKMWTDATELWHLQIRSRGCVALVREMADLIERFNADEKNPKTGKSR